MGKRIERLHDASLFQAESATVDDLGPPAGDSEFGALVRRRRQDARLSQEQLADRSGLSVRTIRNIERGGVARPHGESVRLLGLVLGISELVSDELAQKRQTGLGPEPAPARAREMAQREDVGSAPPTPRDVRSSSPEVPAQLPLDVRGFVGRSNALARLDAALAAASDDPTAVAVCAVSGTAGVGKTALAVHWAHRVRDKFPDGQLYVNLRGFGSGRVRMDPAEAMRGFLEALGVVPQRIPAEPQAQAGLYRSLLADRRMLVILDNARDAQQVRPLLPGSPGGLVVVTSRNQLTSLLVAEAARLIAVDLLTAAEATEMLARRIGPDHVASEPEAVAEIIDLCARLPLALAVVAARAAIRPGVALATLAAELRAAKGRLEGLHAGDPATAVRAALSWSYRTLATTKN